MADLNTLQEKAAAAIAQIPAKGVAFVLQHHPLVLAMTPETTKGTIEFVASVLEVPVNSPEVAMFVASSHRHMFGVKTATSEQGMTYLNGLGLPASAQVKALRIGLCGTPNSVLEARTQHLAFKLGWSQEVLARRVNSVPAILYVTPQCVDANLGILRLLGFSSDEVTEMAARRPSLVTAIWRTKLRQDKWDFINTVMQLSLSAICATESSIETYA